ncbi:MAG TPA: chromosome segregation protein SMC [Thermoplasmata archaeon]|nr:chromosome segregation protein SMC [Thermoplasmata archaeon]
MHLKRLKVRNFKSFAGSTEIPFIQGFTGVAGPNGMGKSNISDAILFVLGPPSSKALRADRLTHLFFNGGASKKAATECEVGLQFDNSDRTLPVDSDEVELTRYVKLAPNDANGYYSYFYVNGRRSTQTEFDGILAHARLSGDGYNLVQQGDVNRIVGMGPVPRRGLVERLAGIAQYDEELGRAEAKRTELGQNLDRIQTLLTEIRSRLAALESQRLQAIRFKDLQDQKHRAEAQLARAGHLLARQEVETCRRQLEGLRTELETLRASATQLEAEGQELQASIDAIEQEIARRGGPEAAKFKEELDAKRIAVARLEENLRQTDEELERVRGEADALAEEIVHSTKESTKLRKEAEVAAKRLASIEADAEARSKELADATGEADPTHGKLRGTRREILEVQQRLETIQKSWQSSVQSLEEAKAAVGAAERELALAEDERKNRELELKDVQIQAGPPGKSANADERSTSELQKQFFQAKKREQQLTESVDRLAREVLELNRRYMALDARLKARTDSGRSGPLAAVDFLLSQRNLGKVPGIRGTVEELSRFDAKHQVALQVSAGSRFQALIVETDQVAEECIRLLRNEKRGRATFLPLTKMLPGRPRGRALVAAKSDGSLGFALDLVKYDDDLQPAFWYVFGETVVMEDLGRARSAMGGVRLVTLQGDLIEATGAITGGFLETGDRARGADSAVELKRLGDELRERSAAETDARAELGRLAIEVRELGEELAKRGARSEADRESRKLLDREVEQARERFEQAGKRLHAAEAVRKAAEAQLAKAQGDSDRSAQEIGSAKEALSQLQEQYLESLPGAVSKRLKSLHEAAEQLGNARVEAARAAEATRAAADQAELAATHAKTSADENQQKVTEFQARHDALAKEREEARSALEALKEVESKQLEAVQGQARKKAQLEQGRLKSVDKLARAQESLRSKLQIEQQEAVRLATAEQHLAEVEAALRDLPEPTADEKPASVDELKRSIQGTTAEIEAMGSVNLMAIEEYDSEKHRLDEFEGEVQRLTNERTELEGLVHEIEERKRVKISEVVVAVDRAYREIYAELSGGGEGEIALESADDPLAGGLLIKARPVGKTVTRLEQLSGGEKSLASLAFIFALQRYDPSPLYVFDEVDMSLDGVNAENVGRMLRRNAEHAQFVVISLRKVTLKFAHRLFGVTMHGDGCSRVVGLKLDEIVDVDERDRAPEPPPVALAPEAA